MSYSLGDSELLNCDVSLDDINDDVIFDPTFFDDVSGLPLPDPQDDAIDPIDENVVIDDAGLPRPISTVSSTVVLGPRHRKVNLTIEEYCDVLRITFNRITALQHGEYTLLPVMTYHMLVASSPYCIPASELTGTRLEGSSVYISMHPLDDDEDTYTHVQFTRIRSEQTPYGFEIRAIRI